MTKHKYAIGDRVRLLDPRRGIATHDGQAVEFVPQRTIYTGIVNSFCRDGMLFITLDAGGGVIVYPSDVEPIPANPMEPSLPSKLSIKTQEIAEQAKILSSQNERIEQVQNLK